METFSSKREQFCLNGIWRFMPAKGSEGENLQENWGSIRVPGDWGYSSPDFIIRGQGPTWDGFNGKELGKGWYEREVLIPADWKNRAILLELCRVSTDAMIYANGIECGRIEWPYGEVDITRAVNPGQKAVLRILVVATADEGKVLTFMGENQFFLTESTLPSRGLIGDVLLKSRPAGAHISDVFVQTSTRKKELALDVELTGVKEPGPVTLTARVLDENTQVEVRSFTAKKKAVAEDVQTMRAAWTWEDPKLWDFLQPNLYVLRLEAKGVGLDDEYAIVFGFREFWIEGKKFLFNGTEFRIRPGMASAAGVAEAIDSAIEECINTGFNWAGLWPSDHDKRGTIRHQQMWCERADRKGLPMSVVALTADGYIWNSQRVYIWDPAGMRKYEKRMAADLRRFRNHPSVLMWVTTANFFGHGQDQNPLFIGQKDWIKDEGWNRNARAGKESVAAIKRHDPTRPVFTHHGTYVGDVHTCNNYLCLHPLQDREEWLSHWAKEGQLPYIAIEFGTPLHSTFLRGRAMIGDTVHTEPLLTEYVAIYFGNEAYKKETAEYRKKICSMFQGDQTYKSWQNVPEFDCSPPMQMLEELFVRNTYRSWRTWGLTGGILPWAMAHGWHPQTHTIQPAGKALMENNGPTLAWIAGAAPTFTAKNHSFEAGRKIKKQVVLINNQRQSQEYAFSWRAIVDGREIAQGDGKGRIETSQNLFLPIEFDTPNGPAGDKVNGQIHLHAKIGNREHHDTFAFRVFAPQPPARGTLAIIDPVGATKELLENLGYKVKDWHGKDVDKLLVIGRNVFSNELIKPDEIETFVREGGRVLVFAQDPRWTERCMGLRICPHISRRIFPVSSSHPVVEGLDVRDLCDWTGESRLIEPYPDYLSEETKTGSNAPWHGWRWGSRGGVSSGAVEKPHQSSWRPILECEFDLAYTPLMELDYGKGRLIWCTLDLEEHAPLDPAARRLAWKIVEYASSASLKPKAGTALYLGNEEGCALLDDIGFLYRKSEKPDPAVPLVVVGPQANPTGLEDYIRGGGKVLFLPRNETDTCLGVSLTLVRDCAGSLNIPEWPEARGLSVSDLRRRTEGEAWVVKAGCELGADGQLGRKVIGEGIAIFCQIDPNRFNADQKTYFRLTRWRQTRALCQILANLGGSFRADARIFRYDDINKKQFQLHGKWRGKIIRKLPRLPIPGEVQPDPGLSEDARQAVAKDVNDHAWEELKMPQQWEEISGEWQDFDGEAVFRKIIDVPTCLAGKDLVVSLDTASDFDNIFFNGKRINLVCPSSAGAGRWHYSREYIVPGKLVVAGRNVIAVRVWGAFDRVMIDNKWQMTLKLKEEKKRDNFYHPDYRKDFKLGDDPYRYFRW